MAEVPLLRNPGRFLDSETFSGDSGSWGGDAGLFLFGPRARTVLHSPGLWVKGLQPLASKDSAREPLARRWGIEAHRCHSHSQELGGGDGGAADTFLTLPGLTIWKGPGVRGSLLKGAREASVDV